MISTRCNLYELLDPSLHRRNHCVLRKIGERGIQLELTGARPKELAATTAGDFDGQSLRLAHRKGRPPKLRVRHVVPGPEGIGFFTAQARGKLPAAYLFTEDGVQEWRRHVWAREIRAAITRHNKKAKGRMALS